MKMKRKKGCKRASQLDKGQQASKQANVASSGSISASKAKIYRPFGQQKICHT